MRPGRSEDRRQGRSGTRADRSPVRALREWRPAPRLPVDALMHAVPNEFMDLEPSAVTTAPSASEQHPLGKFRRWGDGVGTPSGDSTTDHNRPGANPPHTYVDAVPRKSRSPACDAGADVPRRLRRIRASSNAARDGSQMFASQVRRPVGPRCPGPKTFRRAKRGAGAVNGGGSRRGLMQCRARACGRRAIRLVVAFAHARTRPRVSGRTRLRVSGQYRIPVPPRPRRAGAGA